MTKTGWIAIVVAILALLAAFLLWSSSAQAPAIDQGAASDAGSLAQSTEGQGAMDGATFEATGEVGAGVAGEAESAPMSATVTYDGTKYSPATVTIKKGGTVTFTDTTSGTMWVASAMHPDHTGYDGTSRSEHCASGYTGEKPFDQCKKGKSFSFAFKKAGEFPYHDHASATVFGKVVVAP